MENAFTTLEGVATQILEAIEVAFDLPRGEMTTKITSQANASEMRLLHYPAIDVSEIMAGEVSRIWPHFDLGVVTLLFQDAVGGLEIENRKQPGTFTPVECGVPAEMIVNVSETLQRWTNGSLPAGLHRVNIPRTLVGMESGTLPERFTVVYFCKADRAASVGPLKHFVREGNEPVYEDISAIEYHQRRLQSAY
jgi:isopenicillin N synthase-like dioxygenase